MASRRRARRFALQLLYSLDARDEGLRNNLKIISLLGGNLKAKRGPKYRKPLRQVEHQYSEWLLSEKRSREDRAQKVDELLRSERRQLTNLGIKNLLDSHLDDFDDDLINVVFDRKEEEIYDREINEGVRAEEALILTSNPRLHQTYQKLKDMATERFLSFYPDCDGSDLPKTVAYWTVSEVSSRSDTLQNEKILQLAELFAMAHRREISPVGIKELIRSIYRNEIEQPIRSYAEELKLIQTEPAEPVLELEDNGLLLLNNRPIEPEEISFAEDLVQGVFDNRLELDSIIEAASFSWTVSRMSMIDRCILRMSVFELLKRQDVPSLVTIDEAIRIAQDFSERGRKKRALKSFDTGKQWSKPIEAGDRTQDSPKFINGILDRIAKDIGRKDLKKSKT